MGIVALYPKKGASRPGKGHMVYSYLLKELKINPPNEVYCTDITYVPMAKEFVYLVAIMDLSSRRVLSWRLSNTMDSGFYIDALEDAIE